MKLNRSMFFISLGAGFEYYDFIIFGVMTPYIMSIFFPHLDKAGGIIQTFGIFAIGYIARPFGGFALSSLSDRIGRKPVLTFIMSLMAISTFTIGLLPSYYTAGAISTYLLLFFRVMQGVSFGAELPSAITFVSEDSKLKHNGGIATGILMFSISIGGSLAAFVLYILSIFVSKNDMYIYGWRIPFLIGGLLAMVSYYIRLNISETEDFIKNFASKNAKKFVLAEFVNHKTIIVAAIAMNLLAASLISFNMYLPTYLSHYLQYDPQQIAIITTAGIIWSAICTVVFGFINDKINPIITFTISTIMFMICGFWLLKSLNMGLLIYPKIFVLFFQAVIAANIVSYLVVLKNLFPTNIRCSAVSLCYNFSILIASFTPILLTRLIESYGAVTATTYYYFLFISIIAIVAAFKIKYKY